MTWLFPLLRHRATWGVAVSLGVLAAVWGNGAVKYRQGHRDGRTAAMTESRNAAALAKAATDSAWLEVFNAATRDRDRARIAEKAAARATARRMVAEQSLADALASYHADTTPQTSQCDALASSCANAAAAFRAEVDSLTQLVALQDTSIRNRDAFIVAEPVRVGVAVRSGIERYRETVKAPSRITWGAIGAGLGAAAVWLLR